MESYKQSLRNLFCFFVLREQGHLPKCFHSDKLVKVDDFEFVFMAKHVLLGHVYHAEVLLEYLHLGN